VVIKDGEVRHLGANEAGSNQGTLVGPDLIVSCKNSSSQEGRGALPPQRPHPKVLKLEGQNILDECRITRVDGRPEVTVGCEGEAVGCMARLEKLKEAIFLRSLQVLHDNVSA
jgi:hypothetical protein